MSSFIIEQNNSLKIIYNTAFIKDKIDNAIKVWRDYKKVLG